MYNPKVAINSALTGSAAIAAIVGTRIDNLRRPEEIGFPCITFNVLNNAPAVFADNAEKGAKVSIQIDVWMDNEDPQALVNAVNSAMVGAGFVRTFQTELSEGSIIHAPMRYMIKKPV